MPSSYRSKSVRRFEDENNHLTNFIEKDNVKVLATAAIQLFISAPQIEKWFKSSTGTICFLKDFNQKSTYFYRLYSLMQGQLWEHKIRSPFVYKKLSCVFHYLSVNRFNFGFKFICEDEAERFFNVIAKFNVENLDEHNFLLNRQKGYSQHSNSTLTSNGNSPVLSNTSGSSKPSIASSTNSQSISPLSTMANAAAAVAKLSNCNTSSSNISAALNIKNAAKLINSNEYADSTKVAHQSRRLNHSADVKRRIDKSDISCPFRCSYMLDLNGANNIEQNQNKSTNSQISDLTKLSDSNNSNGLKDQSTSMKRGHSLLGKRSQSTYSSAASSLKSLKSLMSHKNQESSDKNLKKNETSLTSLTTSISSQSLKTNKKPKFFPLRTNSREAKVSETELLYTDQTEKIKSMVDYNIEGKNDRKLSSNSTSDDTEHEIFKNLFSRHNIPINKKLFKVLKNYIKQYGGIENFEKALEQDEEKKKLSSFVAALSGPKMYKDLVNLPPNGYQRTVNVYSMRQNTSTPLVDIIPSKNDYPTPEISPVNIEIKKYNNSKTTQQLNAITFNTPVKYKPT